MPPPRGVVERRGPCSSRRVHGSDCCLYNLTPKPSTRKPSTLHPTHCNPTPSTLHPPPSTLHPPPCLVPLTPLSPLALAPVFVRGSTGTPSFNSASAARSRPRQDGFEVKYSLLVKYSFLVPPPVRAQGRMVLRWSVGYGVGAMGGGRACVSFLGKTLNPKPSTLNPQPSTPNPEEFIRCV